MTGLFLMEIKRVLSHPLTRIIFLLTVLSPLAGIFLYRPVYGDTMLSMYLANPAISGGAAGGILFGLLTIYHRDRAKRTGINILTDSIVSPKTTAAFQTIAITSACLMALGLTMLLWLPISKWLIGTVFDMGDYVISYVIFMGLALVIAVVAASAFYQFTDRADMSVALFAAFCGLSLTVWADNWQLCWLNPCVWALSDDFSNSRIYCSVAYMRFNWLLAVFGIWMVSYLCVRRYGKSILGSLRFSLRSAFPPVMAVILGVSSVVVYAKQPMVDDSNPDQSVMTFFEIPFAEGVTYIRRSVYVVPDTVSGTIDGTAVIALKNVSDRAEKLYFGINPGYDIYSVKANGEDISFSVSDYQEYNEALLEVEIPDAEETELIIEYGGFPQEDRNMSSMQGSREISGEYICLENSALCPRLMNVIPGDEGYPAEVEITLPDGMTAVPFGTGEAEIISENPEGTNVWRYEDNGTGGILYAGDYICEEIETDGMVIEFYYGRKHQRIMEEADAADAIKKVADYCVNHYGRLSFGKGEKLKLIQSRVSGGGYASEGASLLNEEDFTAVNLGNSGKGSVPGEVMIHELVHQWWGLGNMFDSAEGSPWSAEGLTVYTTYRIVKEFYGEDYAEKNYVEKWQRAVENYYMNFYVRNPEYLDILPEDKRLEIENSLTYVRQYCEMPLKILKAEELVGGEESMDKILYGIFNRELDPMYPYLTYEEFLEACGLREEDLSLA